MEIGTLLIDIPLLATSQRSVFVCCRTFFSSLLLVMSTLSKKGGRKSCTCIIRSYSCEAYFTFLTYKYSLSLSHNWHTASYGARLSAVEAALNSVPDSVATSLFVHVVVVIDLFVCVCLFVDLYFYFSPLQLTGLGLLHHLYTSHTNTDDLTLYCCWSLFIVCPARHCLTFKKN